MDLFEFYKEVIEPNYNEAISYQSFRLFWNAVTSLNSLPEFIAIHTLGYETAELEDIERIVGQIRSNHACFAKLNACAIKLKHTRQLRGRDMPKNVSVVSSSTGYEIDQPETWKTDLETLICAYAEGQVLLRKLEAK